MVLLVFAVLVIAAVLTSVVGGLEEFPRRVSRIMIWCCAVFLVFWTWSDSKATMDEYMTLNMLVQEEVSQLNEAKKGPLDDTPEIMSLQYSLVQHIKQLEECKVDAQRIAKDPLYEILMKEKLEEYWASPDYSYTVSAVPELMDDK